MEWLQSEFMAIVGARVTGAIELSSDLERMRNSLPRVNHLMEKAEWWRFKNTYIEQLLKELRDAAYDAEDVLAEFDYYQLKQQIEGKTRYLLVSSLISFIRNLVSNSSRKVNDLQNKLDSICGQLESELGPLGLPDGPNPYDKALQHETTSFIYDKVFGREEHFQKVLKLVLGYGEEAGSSNEASSSIRIFAKRRKICDYSIQKQCFAILPIVGMGGMGKTTLAQQIYNDERVKNHFDLRIWVCVSDHFDLKKITKEIIESTNRELASKEGLRNYENQIGFGLNLLNLDSLQQILKEKVTSRKYLLVLDDIWHNKTRDWESLFNPLWFEAKGSMILMTTRMLTVANVAGTLNAIKLESLPDDIFWELFKKCAFGSNDISTYPELDGIGKKIASKLKGCPLATKTVGGILCENMTNKHWRSILDNKLWQMKEDDESILAALRVSYQYLPLHLKRCFLLCSLFTKDFPFNEDDLRPIWMADGIFSHEKDVFYYDKGDGYFGDLRRRSLILPYIVKYFLHDHLLDLAKSLSMDMCYCQDKENDWSLKIHSSARHLSVFRKSIELIDKEISKCNKLRSLFFHDGFIYRDVEIKLGPRTLSSLFNQLPYLRSLDLRKYQIEKLPKDIGNLKLLIYLNLKETGIRSLPDSLCQLYNLEVINLEECPIKSFPDKFSNLINLRLIELTILVRNPVILTSKISQISMLTCLEKLEEFKVLKEEGHKIEELKNMTRLRGYLRITNLENIEGRDDAAQARLNNKEHLTDLVLRWSPSRDTSSENGDTAADKDTIEGLQPHSNLESLNIENYRGRTLPSWFRIEILPHLVTFRIIGCSNLESLEDWLVTHQLSSLKDLCIEDCVNLVSLPLEWINSSSLTSLKIKNCPLLSCTANLMLSSSLTNLHLDSCGEFGLSLSSCLQILYSLKHLNLINFQHITSLPTQVTNHLSELVLSNCAELQYLEVSNSSTLKKLDIKQCPKLIQPDPSESDTETPREPNKQLDILCIDNTSLLKMPFLRTPLCSLSHMLIKNCHEERMFEGHARGWFRRFENLTRMDFFNCFNLEALPEVLHTIGTLLIITIIYCPKIESLPENGLPPSLLCVYYCGCHPALTEQLKQYGNATESTVSQND